MSKTTAKSIVSSFVAVGIVAISAQACDFSTPSNSAPGQCFTTPGPIGCCGPLAAAAHERQGIMTYGCTNGRQRVYQAKFTCAQAGQNTDTLCKSGKYTATVAGKSMTPSSCGNGSALFDVDDSTCPATW